MRVVDALPLLPQASGLNNQIYESASSPRPSSCSLHTASSELRRYRVPISPNQPVPTLGTTRPHLLLDFAHAFDTRFGGLLSPPVSAPVYSPGAERGLFGYPTELPV
jgi:hypothetical protein